MVYQTLYIFKDEALGFLFFKNSFNIKKQGPPSVCESLSFAGGGKCLTREAGAQYIEVRNGFLVYFCDIPINFFIGMILPQYGYCVRLYLRRENAYWGVSSAYYGLLQSFTDSSYSSEQIYKSNHFTCRGWV